MNKEFFGFILVFVLLSAAAVTFGNLDQITPNVAQAQAEMAVGEPAVQVISQGASMLVKWLLGAVVAGVAAAVFSEARKAYKTWQRNSRVRRWASGPNAQWKQPQSQLPKLRREDLMLLALSGRLPADAVQAGPRRGTTRARDEEEEVELEMPL